MSREVFMRELEYLIQDIPEEEKADALQYYKDYLDEAGEGREEEVIREFGSPEKIAAMIRSDLAGNLLDGGEFTDKGYDDERFKDPNYQVANRYELPEVSKENMKEDSKVHEGTPPPRTSKAIKVILWIILILVAFPALVGIGGGVFGLFSGLAGILLSLVIVIGVLTFAFMAVGIALFGFGIVSLVVTPLEGMLILGLGLIFLGIGMLFLIVSILFYGKFIPFLFRSILDGFNCLFHRGKGNKK